ncbi:PREDICTED: hydrocephalus-inducing protein-like [Wasmannia auropunctata]|uniref:hydrocephalus-inducing protein-like n=1 Tax=Wasmannia auropunctata TaxID=64793 RepID=UPI0005F0ACE5|nr:PREDICTED: hydrocephalus-inducing protein-like [Wasmannia auropunctata]
MDEREDLVTRYPTVHNFVEILAAITGKLRDQKQESSTTPSEYIKQMLMSTQERINYLLKPGRSINVRSLYSGWESQCFRVSPSIVLFQRFVPGNLYNIMLTIQNVTKMSRPLKLSHDPDPFFSVEYHGSNYSTMVAPGLVHIYNVRFSPSERRDYEYRVEFINDTEVFAVPVIAIGPRPILDIPDRIEIPATAVKIPSSKTILVRNVGDAPAIFNFCPDSSYFSVEPSKGILGEEETMQLTANFLSEKSGDFETNLFLNYESGEKLCLTLRSSAMNCMIRIDRGSIRMEDTYLSLSRSKVLTIHNRSDYVVKFQWMRYKDKDTDIQRKEKYKNLFQLVRNVEVVRCVSLVHYNICLPDIHELVCQRIYTDEIASLTNENFRYNHMSFLFTPEEGEIWPQSSIDITVIFQAMEVGEISSVAYLEVTGREDRIPLSLHGTGKGPVFHLNVITVDLSNIFLCSVHNYEIVAANKGHICGTLVHKARPTDFGGTINITPCAQTLKPDEYKSFNLSFSSNRKGDFVERIDFVIKESLEVLSLHIKGCVICPTLHFDRHGLDFGAVALGFSGRQEVNLRNLSLVPVAFGVTIMEDGDQAPLTYEEFAISQVKPSFPINPREFTIIPQKGVVQAHSSLKLKVTYLANVIRSGRTNMRVDMWNSDSDPVILPLSFCGAIPSLSIKPAEINIRFSFINLPYARSINVENDSDLDGYFYIVPQMVSENIPIVYSLSTNQGFLKARQSKTIDVTIITKTVGKQTTTLNMLTMGQQTPVTSCAIICNGQGPVVSAQPICLNFGDIQVLQDKVMHFHIINDSPIPAQFKLTSPKKNSLWLVEPSFGEVEPNASAKIIVKLFLRDTGKYTDNIIVHVINSRSFSVNMIATGIGCNIVFEPQIFPIFDMGFLFSHQNLSLPITMKNFGTRHCQIMWSNDPEVRIQKSQTYPKKFQIEPSTVEVPANSSNVVQCKICWDVNEILVEDWYIFEQIFGQGKRKLIGTSTFKATFTEPRIAFNKRELTFRIDICPEGEELQQTDELIVTNQSRLSLNVLLYTDPPFYLMNNQKKFVQKKKIVLTDGTITTIPIKFSPNINPDNPYSQSYTGALWFEYDEHPNKDKIQCTGAVNFPNITLHCKDLIINCISGSTAKGTFKMINNGPIPVIYKFLWAGESIEIQRGAHDVGNFTNHLQLQINTKNNKFNPQSYKINKKSDTQKTENKSLDLSISTSYKLQDSDSKNLLMEIRPEMLDETLEKLRNIFMSTTETSYLRCLDDPDILALIDSDLEPPTKELLDDILDIIPHEGVLVPYSSQYVRIIFHASEPMQVKVAALCEILQGPTEVVNVFANADVVRYSVDRQVIDFGQQLFGELCRSSFTLENHSTIFLNYKINKRNLISKISSGDSTIDVLIIEPNKGSINPLSSLKITIEFQPILLGAFEIEFELQVAHVDPLIITAKGVTSYPQIYPYISRVFSKQYPAELGYRAIQLLSPNYIATKKQVIRTQYNEYDEKPKSPIPEWDERILLNDGWDLISQNEEILPSIVDIEMSIDRLLATRFIEENATLIKHPIPHKNAVIPSLYTPTYIIDMGYIAIGLKTCYTTMIVNYGPWNADVTIKKLEKKQLENFGILVQFEKTMLAVGKIAYLTIIWQPTTAKYTERSTKEQHSIYLEVSRGSTIPLIIKSVITYPFVTVNTKLLDFRNVIVGECLMMNVLMKNEGFIDCYWEARISFRKKQEDCPFYLNYKSNLLLPGHSDVINVYFKPHKTCHMEANLKIIVKMGLETQMVTLLGHGVEHKLRISDLDINFPSTVLFTELLEKIFTIENTCNYPVEFFWHHLDSLFREEEQIAEALTRYYGVKEILLPHRKLRERIPSSLMEFYNSLMSEMAHALSAEVIEEKSATALNDDDKLLSSVERKGRIRARKKSSSTSRLFVQQSPTRRGSKMSLQKDFHVDRRRRKKSTGYSSTSTDTAKRDCPPMSVVSELDFPRESPILPTSDPEELHNLLLCYIETLRKDPSFRERMRNPVKELFDSRETKSIPELDTSQPAKKVCIIFHGAPFTEYQETACRSAKALQVSLLCIDNEIIRGIALGDNWVSVKLRQIVDDTYQEYLLAFERHKENMGTKLLAAKKIDVEVAQQDRETIAKKRSPITNQIKSPKLNKITKAKPDLEMTMEINGYSESDDPPQEFPFEKELANIPREQDLKFLDAISLYECKIQTILLLQKVFPRYTTIESKVSEKNQDSDTFLGIEIDLLIEVLRERLSSPDFKSGFVLQTLNNVFFKSDVTTLLVLLNIIGHVEYSLFITFLNSMDTYTRKIEELRKLEAKKLEEEVAKKIQEIDEMSLSEYELLPEDDKKFYLELTLPIKKQEVLQRQTQFLQKITELRKRKKFSQQVPNSQTSKNKKVNRKAKNEKVSDPEEKSQTSKALTNKKEIQDHKELKNKDSSKSVSEKQEMSKELKNIADAMNDYYNRLSAIENIIKNWDPLKKDTLFEPQSKILKTDRPIDTKDKSSDVSKETYINGFHIWYVNATDPWNRAMYDVIVNQIYENSLAKKALPAETVPILDLESKRYYILKPRGIRKRDIEDNGIFHIVSLSTLSNSMIMETNSSRTSVISKQANSVKNTKRKERILKNKESLTVSLNASTVVSTDTNASGINTIFEKILKSRWILQPNEIQKFKIRYQPEEAGIHRQTYALSILDGNNITYDINVSGIADVPKLDTNPHTIFSKIKETKVNDIIDPTYFSDVGIYDFGSLLVFQKDKSAHRREAKFKFCNVSKVNAEVFFSLEENNPDIFIIEPEKLYIQAGQCELLKISAGVTKLGSFSDKLYICITNNPHIESIELRCNGSKLDIEFESKQLSFGQVLLYRRTCLTCSIRNRSPIEIFWHLQSNEPLDSQISISSTKGIIKAQSDQKIEFCYHANKIGIIKGNLTFKAFFHEDDTEPIFTETVILSGETYDVAVDINYANPIDLKYVKVGFPTSANFTISNRGDHEVKYAILLEEQNKLAKIAPSLPLKLNEDIEISPVSGSVQSKKEAIVQVTFIPKNEITLNKCPILRCHLLDINKAAVIAEIPLTVSLTAYYTRFRIYPHNEINFGSLGICTKKILYLNVENVGQFPLHYSIKTTPVKYPSAVYMTENIIKEDHDKSTETSTKKAKSRIEKSDNGKAQEVTTMLKIGPFTVTKTEGKLQPGETDTVAIECYPEFVGSQEEDIIILVPDSVHEYRNGKLIKLSINSCIPSIDLQDLGAIFHENHIVNRIEDFVCSKEIGAHTVFACQEKCLYFRYVSVFHTHTTYLVLYNRNVIPADVELILLADSFIPKTMRPDTFVLTPERERIPPMSHKRFAISFNPTFIETCYAIFEIAVELPPHLKDEKFFVKLVGQACVPEVTIIEPPSGKRERTVLNFGRTLVGDSNGKKFAFKNIGVIPAKVIIEIYEDPDILFTLHICEEMKNLSRVSNNQYIVVRLIPEETISLEVKFTPREIGKYESQVRLFIADNPYENLIIDLKSKAYAELIVLDGLELTNTKLNSVIEKRDSNAKSRRSSKSNSTARALTPTTLPVSLIYKLDYGYCFVNKIYRKSFKVVNKSMNQYLRFQWSAHPNVVFTPSIGHLKPLTCKEIVATFLSSEPAIYVDTRLECTVCAIELADPSKESSWDDRETEVRWVVMNSDAGEQETNTEIAKKIVEPVNEPSHEVVPGTTKCIQVLLNVTVAFSKYSCSVKEINFKNTLMFQTSEHAFTFSNTGTVDVEYAWQINMDEQYPMRPIANYSQDTSRLQRNDAQSKTTLLTSHEPPHQRHSPSFDGSVKSNRRQLLSSRVIRM